MTLIQGSNGIEGVFNNLFSFLRRKTDYFANDGKYHKFYILMLI